MVVISELGILLVPKIAFSSDAIIYYDKDTKLKISKQNKNILEEDVNKVINDYDDLISNVRA